MDQDTCAACAERPPNGHLPRPDVGADEQQVCHIRTGNQQEEADGAEQHCQRRTRGPDHCVAERLHGPRCSSVHRAGSVASVRRYGDTESRIAITESPSRSQPARDRKQVARVDAVGIDLERHPRSGFDIELLRVKSGRQDADDDMRNVAELNGPSDDAAGVAKRPRREVVTQYRDRGAAGPIFIRCEEAPCLERRVEQLKELTGDPGDRHLLRLGAQRGVRVLHPVRRDILEGIGALAPRNELRHAGDGAGRAGRDEEPNH